MENIVYFGNGCPKCKILISKLDDKNIIYDNGDLTDIIELGFRTVPILKVNEEYLDFGKAVAWVNKK